MVKVQVWILGHFPRVSQDCLCGHDLLRHVVGAKFLHITLGQDLAEPILILGAGTQCCPNGNPKVGKDTALNFEVGSS